MSHCVLHRELAERNILVFVLIVQRVGVHVVGKLLAIDNAVVYLADLVLVAVRVYRKIALRRLQRVQSFHVPVVAVRVVNTVTAPTTPKAARRAGAAVLLRVGLASRRHTKV